MNGHYQPYRDERPLTVNALKLPAPAKLNLFLHITGQRPDGYHSLQTLFQLLDWADELSFSVNSGQGIRLTCSNKLLATSDNLIMKAARALEQQTGQPMHVDIHLHKVLPIGGGLGGGSSNAATALLGLNALFNLKLNKNQLMAIATTLGADVPIFVGGHSCWADGIGDELSPMELPEHWYLILHPLVHVSTEQLFTNPELTRNTSISKIRPDLADTGHNDFEPLVRRLYPIIDQGFQLASSYGKPKLTGTGACLFIQMPTEMSARQSLLLLSKELKLNQDSEFNTYIAKGVRRSATQREIKRLKFK